MSSDRKQIEILEVEEHLFAHTTARAYAREGRGEAEGLANYVRETLRMHRFFVLNWLLINGVPIPAELCSDTLHVRPGEQHPDRLQNQQPPAV